jgi:hypothetical protein
MPPCDKGKTPEHWAELSLLLLKGRKSGIEACSHIAELIAELHRLAQEKRDLG